MRRRDLEHLIRAAATVADDDDIVIVGSQSVLATLTDPPDALTISDEADVYPRNHADIVSAPGTCGASPSRSLRRQSL